jgi:uncharacterized protein with HEPN domain
MSERKDIDLVQDIKECINRIASYTQDIGYDEFESDLKTQDAVVRNLEIMGEAVKSLSKELKENYSDIPWKNIAGTRDTLIHDYFGLNIDIVWNIAKEEIPDLTLKIDDIIRNIEN